VNSQSLPPGITPQDKVVLFDGECVLCSSGAQLLMRVDKRRIFKLGTVQSDAGRKIMEWYGLSADAPASFILSEGLDLYVRSTAYVRIVARLGFPWNMAASIWLIPRPIRDRIYDWIAQNRFRLFGRRDSCMMPTEEQRSRFL
jgi:predicted DCC family thiol-disulfide oxidoreductase YuxK